MREPKGNEAFDTERAAWQLIGDACIGHSYEPELQNGKWRIVCKEPDLIMTGELGSIDPVATEDE